MKRCRALVVALSLAGAWGAVAAADAPVARICHEGEDSYPWILKDRPGLTTSLLKLTEKTLGGRLEVLPLPWKRCLEEAKAGTLDGVVKISYTPERAQDYVYPTTADGQPDASKRLLIDSYSFYRLKGAAVAWDGKTLKADGAVGAQSGFSVVKQLQGMGARVDDGTRSADDNLKKLVDGRVVAVALQTEEGDISVAAKPEFAAKIERMSPFLVEKPYFVIFSKAFQAKDPAAAKRIWDAIATARESVEYKELVKKFK